MPTQSHLTSLALAAALTLMTAGAQAVTLNKAFAPSISFLDTALPGTTEVARPELAGLVLEDTIQAFAFSGLKGTVQNRVVREDGTGTLDFYWRIDLARTDTNKRIEALRLGNFGYASIVDADWRIDGLGAQAPFVGRVFSPDVDPTGAINFLFTDPAIPPGSSSRFFFLHTDAKSYARTAVYDLVGTGINIVSGQFQTFAPVPEPSTYALLALGLIGIGAMARRRQA